MKIVVGATAAGHKGEQALHWLAHAEALRAATPHEVAFFLAAETQPDGLEPRLHAVEARVRALGGTVWRFMLDDGSPRIDSGNRLVRICEGRNLVIEHALRTGAEWVLFADADIELPADVLAKLLQLDHPFCGFSVPGYGLAGPVVPGYAFPVQAYGNTAGAWFVHRRLFRRFRWLWDPDDGLTDDPATHRVIRGFMLDDGSPRIDSGNRLVRICEGRNLVIEHALRTGAEWVLFADADIELPADVLAKLLQLDHPFCGFSVPGYGLAGPVVPGYAFPVQAYGNTAGAWFVHRRLFRRFRWLWDPDDGLTDDPATHRVIREQLGFEQRNRLDVIGRHVPPLVPFERRTADVGIRRHALAGHPVAAVLPAYLPTAAHVDMTVQALDALLDECCARVLLLDNGGVAPHHGAGLQRYAALAAAHGQRFQVMAAEGCNIHQMWNLGWRAALHDFGDAVLVAFVNNDITFRPGTLEVLARAVLRNEVWVTYPDPLARVADGVRLTGRTRATRGSKRHGGLTGHCFLIKGGIHTIGGLPMFDERFHCWYGDDDFAFRVAAAGYQIHCVEGLPCDHLNEATLAHRPDWAARRSADRELFTALWGEG